MILLLLLFAGCTFDDNEAETLSWQMAGMLSSAHARISCIARYYDDMSACSTYRETLSMSGGVLSGDVFTDWTSDGTCSVDGEWEFSNDTVSADYQLTFKAVADDAAVNPLGERVHANYQCSGDWAVVSQAYYDPSEEDSYDIQMDVEGPITCRGDYSGKGDAALNLSIYTQWESGAYRLYEEFSGTLGDAGFSWVDTVYLSPPL